VAFAAVAALGPVTAASAGGPCKYMGGGNALPTSGLPVVLFANGDTSPSGYVGVGDGTSANYAQVSGNAGGAQVEGKSSTAGESGYANTSGAYGSC
jgi:hypothetical protein